MPCFAARTLLLALLVALSPLCGLAQEPGIEPKLHPWGQFEPGAWKLVRVVTETLDDKGQVVSTSTTDIKTTLLDLDNESVSLEIQPCVEVVGKRFDPQPEIVKQGFHGEALGPNLQIKPATAGQVTIEDRKIACRIQQIESTGPGNKTAATLYYSHSVAPYVLKRESVTTDAESSQVVGETTVEVIAADMPQRVLSQVKNAFHVKSVQKHAKGTVITVAVLSPDVPGGVVAHSSKELDQNGRVVRRSTLELLSYGTDPETERSGLFGRKPPAAPGRLD